MGTKLRIDDRLMIKAKIIDAVNKNLTSVAVDYEEVPSESELKWLVDSGYALELARLTEKEELVYRMHIYWKGN